MRVHTLDKAAQDRSVVHTEQRLGLKQEVTREGFLLCKEVPIARTGMQEYLNDEICDEDDTDSELHGARGKNGIVQVLRDEADVFRPETMASFEGKDVVDDHPEGAVDPDNYRQHTVGVILNPRRGEGPMSEFIIADLLIKEASAIAAVRAGKREVSCGYDAEYEVLGPGRARQYDIIGNHVALVDRGRCGFRCAIGDKEPDMKTKTSLFTRVMDAIANKDRTALNKAMDEVEKEEKEKDEASEKETMEPTGTHIHVHLGGEEETKGGDPASAGAADEDDPDAEEEAKQKASDATDKRLMALEAGMHDLAESMRKFMSRNGGEDAEGEEGAEEAEGDDPDAEDEEAEVTKGEGKKEKEGDKKKDKAKDKTKDAAVKDSAEFKAEFKDVMSDVEILSPGLQLPTFDAAKPAQVTQDSLCLAKRRSLAAAMRDEANGGADSVKTMLGKGKTLAGLDCGTVGTVFNGAVALMKDRNTRDDTPMTLSKAMGKKTKDAGKAPTTPAELNKANREHFKQPVR